jgi:hypothetical protein
MSIDANEYCAYFCTVSTVAEIISAIDQLSPRERAELEALLHPDWDIPLPLNETPPGVREKLAEAASGHFKAGDRSNISKILATLK